MGEHARADMEANRRAAAVNELLGRIGLSTGNATEWWNFTAYPELGGRTPTQAWLAGDHDAVEKLVWNWFEHSRVAAERADQDPEATARVERRRRELAARYG